MAFRYTNIQYTEMVRTLARCLDNVALACREFNARYGCSVSARTMLAATQRLRDSGTFFPNTALDTGTNVRTTRLQERDTYLRFLQETLPDLLDDVPAGLLRDMFYQQDGAPAHFTWTVRRHLDAEYGSR